jgi:mRNA-degrading endonuclease toxin of MazEF toxin-antitoxin module
MNRERSCGLSYHGAREGIIVAAITSNVTRNLVGEHVIVDWQDAGLAFPSTVTGIIRTIKRSMVRRKLGSLATQDLPAANRNLRRSLGL